jgi:methylated-DNA-[protein]-cysteine S-methyltransferase
MNVKPMKKMEKTQVFFCLRQTSFGPVAVVWSVHEGQAKINRVLLSSPDKSAKQLTVASYQSVKASSCSEINVIADQVKAFLNGEDIRFSLDMVRLDLCSDFQQNVLLAEHGQRIAKHLGNANGARAVGTALAHNPFPIIIPCHRAIRSDGTLGGYQGGLRMKRALLEMEGILFNDRGRIMTEELHY